MTFICDTKLVDERREHHSKRIAWRKCRADTWDISLYHLLFSGFFLDIDEESDAKAVADEKEQII